jgi:hypothetical protein
MGSLVSLGLLVAADVLVLAYDALLAARALG